MQSLHPDFDAAVAKARHADIRSEAEHWRQTQGVRPGWLPRQGCRLLCRLGQAMIWLGEQLQSWSAARLVGVPGATGAPGVSGRS
jgi:hypothetical protein